MFHRHLKIMCILLIRFCWLLVLLSSCVSLLIYFREKDIQVSSIIAIINAFVCFSFQVYQFLLPITAPLLFAMYTFRFAMSSCWIDIM